MTGSLQLTLQQVAAVREAVGEGDPELLHDCIEGQTDLFEVMDWLIGKLADEECLEAAISDRVKTLGERKSACVARQERIRSALQVCLDASGQKSLRRPEATLTIANRKPGIAHIDEAMLPEQFWKVEKRVNRSAIGEALRDGGQVPGVTLDNGGVSLTVRRK